MEPTQADTETWIFGSGFATWSWWRSIRRQFDYNDDHTAPDGWTWVVTADNRADGKPSVTKTITHAQLVTTFALIRDGGGGEYVSNRCREECKAVFTDPDDVDFDADTADQVVQVAVFGQVHYG